MRTQGPLYFLQTILELAKKIKVIIKFQFPL